MNQARRPMEFRPLTPHQEAELADGLELAATIARSSPPLSADQVQTLYDTLLGQSFCDEDTVVALGFAFGDLIKKQITLEWILLDGDYGEEISLAVPGLRLVCSPISMMRKRLERGEAWDVDRLASDMATRLRSQANDPTTSKR